MPVGRLGVRGRLEPDRPIAELAAGGAEVVVNLNASPSHRGKGDERERLIATRAADASLRHRLRQPRRRPGRAGLRRRLFLVDDTAGWWPAAQFARGLIVDLDIRPVYRKRLLDPRERAVAPPLPEVPVSRRRPRDGPPLPRRRAAARPVEEVYEALRAGLRDYVGQERLRHVVIGLSGGVDSSLVATLAADAWAPSGCTAC